MSVFQAKAFLKHLRHARGPHGVHSPFVFELITQVLVPERHFYCFDALEAERQKWLQDGRKIHVQDLGAGSHRMKSDERSISEISRYSLQSPDGCRLLFKLTHHLGAKRYLELGTSLGLTAAYFAHIGPQVSVTTVEGAPALVHEAEQLYQRLSLNNVRVLEGDFDAVISSQALADASWDVVYIDGNHRGEATLRYAAQLWPALSPNGCMIFDDIHWSKDMEQAWLAFVKSSDVTLSLDFFRFGIAFKNAAFSKEHMVLKLNA